VKEAINVILSVSEHKAIISNLAYVVIKADRLTKDNPIQHIVKALFSLRPVYNIVQGKLVWSRKDLTKEGSYVVEKLHDCAWLCRFKARI
jgi:hypothetical protein